MIQLLFNKPFFISEVLGGYVEKLMNVVIEFVSSPLLEMQK